MGASHLVARHGQDAAGRFVKPPPFDYVAPDVARRGRRRARRARRRRQGPRRRAEPDPAAVAAPRPPDGARRPQPGRRAAPSIAVNGELDDRGDDPPPQRSSARRTSPSHVPAARRGHALHRPRRDPHPRHDRRQPRPRRSGGRAARRRARPRRHVRGPQHPRHPHDRAADFFAGYFTTALEADEILTRGHASLHAAPRHGSRRSGDRAPPRRLRDGRRRRVGRRSSGDVRIALINVADRAVPARPKPRPR